MTARGRAGAGAVLALVLAGQFMVVLDLAIVNVALPSIGRDLAVGRDDLQWAVVAYAIVLGGFLLLGGRAADLLGRRRVWVTGVALFAAASLGAALSTTLGALVTARGVQGLGAALTAAAGLSILTATFPEGAARTKALGAWGAVSASGGTAGVVISGVLTDGPGWEWIFLVNVPVGIALVAGALRALPADGGVRRGRIDVAGAVTVTTGLLLLVLGVGRGSVWGWTDARTLGALAGAVALLAAFVAVEARVARPLVPLGRLADRTVALANGIAFLLLGAFFSLIFIGTLVMQEVLGYSALETGFAWLAVSVPALVGALLSGAALVPRAGVRPVLVGGLTILTVALLGLSRLDAETTYATGLLPWFVLAGLGIGVCLPAVQVAAFTGSGAGDSGLASGLVNTSQQVGGAVGVAVLSAVAVAADVPAEGFAQAFLVGAGIALAGLGMALLLRTGQRVPAGSSSGRPSPAKVLHPKVVISEMRPSSTRSTSSLNTRNTVSP